ncbi:hypothetical protein COCVIDRAFT_32433 [Bipolaris victoriae FI3]|uniref:Uncharacterized protein n=1 Tax=Bipolaris victoriae (strain FI3) TaxID=930091 RepID=W7FAY9_BIPV3|nr:hypothetical protein COCVIDRAFT_32433 [Bipolaris victoriae FI3]
MVPHAAGTSEANIGDTQTRFPEPTLQEHGPVSGTALAHPYPSGSAHSFPAPYGSPPPHRIESLPSPAMANNAPELSSCMTEGNEISYASKISGGGQPALPQHVINHPPAGKTIQATPVSPKASGVKSSRLPSSNVPRKAPLRGNSGSSKSPSQHTNRKISKPRQTQLSSQPESSTDTATPTQKRRRVPTKRCQSITRQSPVVLIKVGRSGKGTKKDDIQESRDDQKEEGGSRKKRKGNEHENDATRTTVSGRVPGEGRNITKNFLQGTKIVRSTYVPSSLLPNRTVRRRPMYDYDVPLELEGIRQALGPDDWNEYVYLMEALWLNKVTAHEFEQGAKPLFQFHLEGMRKRMNSVMVVKMIMPRLEQVREELMAMSSAVPR